MFTGLLHQTEVNRTFWNYYTLFPLSNDKKARKNRLTYCIASIAVAIFSAGIYPLLLAGSMWIHSIREKQKPAVVKQKPVVVKQKPVVVKQGKEEIIKSTSRNKIPNPKKLYKNLKLTDQDIIARLINQGFNAPEEKGGGGRCLFHSIFPHLQEEDFESAQAFCLKHRMITPLFHDKEKFKNWLLNPENKMNVSIEQANQLRAFAMAIEENFFKTVRKYKKVTELLEEDVDWISEFYKDMQQELETQSIAQSRHNALTVSNQEKFDYFKKNFVAYKRATERETNFAGTTEAIALSRLFNRQLQFFGHDTISSEYVQMDENGHIQPYYRHVLGRLPFITIFQCTGGGHYKFLSSQSSAV